MKKKLNDVKKGKVKVPWYVIGFFITCALFSIGIISPALSDVCKAVSNKLEIFALAAIGLRVNVKDLIKQGKVVSLIWIICRCITNNFCSDFNKYIYSIRRFLGYNN